MTMHLSYYPDSHTAIWLDRTDAQICAHILRTCGAARPGVLEIGVFRGAWSATMAMNVPTATVLGIDPYPDRPGLQEAKRDAEALFGSLGITGRARVVPDWDTALALADRPERFDLIHIDGLHAESATEVDLRHAAQVLGESGVIAVDDYCRPQFPGTASAVYRSLEPLGLRAFLATPHKIFLCRPGAYERWFATMSAAVATEGLERWSPFSGTPAGTLEGVALAPTVLGSEVIVCLGGAQAQPAQVSPVRRFVRDWVPPALRRAIWSARRRIG